MRRDIERKRAKMNERYVASKRHTIQVDFDDYMRELRAELRAGARRGELRRRSPATAPALLAAPDPVSA
jgi:hypothetical protein